MKSKKIKEVEKLLKDSGCQLKTVGAHNIWAKNTGQIFSLPNHKTISPGILRQLTKFLEDE